MGAHHVAMHINNKLYGHTTPIHTLDRTFNWSTKDLIHFSKLTKLRHNRNASTHFGKSVL